MSMIVKPTTDVTGAAEVVRHVELHVNHPHAADGRLHDVVEGSEVLVQLVRILHLDILAKGLEDRLHGLRS
eukprot:1367194-Heterocapsa_arctica.AAC.1